MNAYTAEGWGDFAVAMAGAAAALAGLLFVALSINLEAILRGPRLPARAGHTLILLAVPVVLSLLLLIPGQPSAALGVELIGTGAVTAAVLGYLEPPWRRPTTQTVPSWITTVVAPAVLLGGGVLVSGIGLVTESLGGLYWIPAAVIVAVAAALLNAWVLLVEIRR